MQSKIFSLATLSFSDFIGKWQKKKKKKDKIHQQDSFKKSDILLWIFRRKSSKQLCSAV